MPLDPEELEQLVSAWLEHGARCRARTRAGAPREESQRALRAQITALASAHARGEAAEVERLQAEFVQACQRFTEPPDPGEWAADRLRSVMFEGGEDAWRVLTELLRRAPDDESLEWIGVGPVEDFLTDETAARYRDRIEAHLVGGRSLRVALAAAWGLPESIRALAARYPPGPGRESPRVTTDLVERYAQYRRAWLEAGRPAWGTEQARAALRLTGLDEAEAALVRRLVEVVVRALRADDAYAKALAGLAGLGDRRRALLDDLTKGRPPGPWADLLPDPDDPAAEAWFGEQDRHLKERVLGELRPAAGLEQRLAAAREAWGDEAVSAVLARVEELEGPDDAGGA